MTDASNAGAADSPLFEEVLGGENRELQVLAARGVLPLEIHEIVTLQVALSASPDEEVSQLAADSLRSLEADLAVRVIGEGVGPEVLAHLATQLPHPQVVEAILQLRGVSTSLLTELAPRLDADLQEILLLRQDLIVQAPEILEALELNPSLTAYSRRRVREYREHLLPRERRVRSAAEIEEEAEALTKEEIEEAIEAAAAAAPAEGAIDDLTGLSESQIRGLPVPVRLQLSRGASRTLRNILIKDTNPQIATSVLQYNPMTENEVEEIADNRGVRGEVLTAISNNRSWMRRYPIVVALVRNPRCPAALAVRLVARLSVRDLNNLRRDRGVTHNVRSAAARLYRIKRN